MARWPSAHISGVGVKVPASARVERARVCVHGAAHEGGERVPRIGVVRERDLGLVDEAGEAVGGERAQQVVLAGVAAVQGADADARVLGDVGDGRRGIGGEDRARRLEDDLVVDGGLGGLPLRGGSPTARF